MVSRIGGKSAGTYEGTNISFGTGDDQATVTTNRLAVYKAIDASPSRVIAARQVHSDRVLFVKPSSGTPLLDYWRTMEQEGDGLITSEPGLFLQMSFGDCTPLLFFDPVNLAAGIAHAGWKGTISRVGARTVEAMVSAFGSRPDDIRAGIGPAIGPCCYQVREDVAGPARQGFGSEGGVLVEQPDGTYIFDLWEANRQALLAAGVQPDHIEVAGICTRCRRDLFFSNRAGDKGRFAALIAVRSAAEES